MFNFRQIYVFPHNSPMNLFYPNICTFDCKTAEKIIKLCILFSFYIFMQY